MVHRLMLLTICFSLIGFSQISGQSIFNKWEQLSAYHEVMAKTFHPAEEGNVEPIKNRSGELVALSKTLLKSDIPAEFASAEMEEILKALRQEGKVLHKKIKKGKASDEEIKQGIFALHDVFHRIVGLCKKDEHI